MKQAIKDPSWLLEARERCEFQFKPSGNRCQKEAGHTGSHIHTVAAEEALMPSPTAQPPQELVSLDHKELASFFWRHAPVLWKDRWTCRCGKWALSRELNSVEQADESRSQHVAEAFLEWRAALTRGAVGG